MVLIEQIASKVESIHSNSLILLHRLASTTGSMNKLPLQFPLLVCAPMVEQSELPFRMLTRKYGCNLCYTPMLHSKMMTTQKKYKEQHFTTCPEDRPLVAQLCGNDPQTMVKAAKMIEDEVDAIDVNFGCPQGIARRGRYGSFLLEEPEVVEQIVQALAEHVKVPVFCKMRIRKTEQKTFEVINKIAKAGCSLLTVHGRTKEQNKEKVGACDWQIIKKIKEALTIPVVANGGIYTNEDVHACLKETGVDGVMSAESLLENPALFCPQKYCLDKLAVQYLEMAEKYPGASDSCIRGHLFKMCFTGLAQHVELRERMTKARGIDQFRQIVLDLQERRKDTPIQNKFGWYVRYWHKNKEPAKPIAVENEDVQSKKENAQSENNIENQYTTTKTVEDSLPEKLEQIQEKQS